MLKHVQFAAQRISFVGTANADAATSSTGPAPNQAAALTANATKSVTPASQVQQTSSAVPAVQPLSSDKQKAAVPDVKPSPAADAASLPLEEFTLDKIEQSIADIEAELGWVSEPAQPMNALVLGAETPSATPSAGWHFTLNCQSLMLPT